MAEIAESVSARYLRVAESEPDSSPQIVSAVIASLDQESLLNMCTFWKQTTFQKTSDRAPSRLLKNLLKIVFPSDAKNIKFINYENLSRSPLNGHPGGLRSYPGRSRCRGPRAFPSERAFKLQEVPQGNPNAYRCPRQ